MLLSLIKVQGHSMEPYLKGGSFFIATNLIYKLRKPKNGDIILFKYNSKIVVKKIYKIEERKYYIEGINKNDTKDFHPITRSSILGKLLFKI